MNSSITAVTKIDMVVNGQHTFSIENGPDTGLLWVIRTDMNRDNYCQGLLSLAEACHNITIHKINVDSERVKNSKKGIDEG